VGFSRPGGKRRLLGWDKPDDEPLSNLPAFRAAPWGSGVCAPELPAAFTTIGAVLFRVGSVAFLIGLALPGRDRGLLD